MALSALVLTLATAAASAEDEIGWSAAGGDVLGFEPELLREASLLTGETSPSPPATDLTLGGANEPAAPGPDWGGLARDTAFLIGYQTAFIGLIYVLPEDVSNWSEDQKQDIGDRWVRHVQHPEIDTDSWFVNYVTHPYFGATYYIRARERGFGEFSSFVYSAFASTLYEFGVEAFFEEPSIQDLIVTPIGGTLVGMFLFEPLRRRIRAKPELKWYDRVALVLTDPIGAMNGVFERLLGIKSDVRVGVKPP
ncbi:MAG: DUF3943 domain-containing protein, partial [Candidatus Rokuibacteriota bacterium]